LHKSTTSTAWTALARGRYEINPKGALAILRLNPAAHKLGAPVMMVAQHAPGEVLVTVLGELLYSSL